MGFKAHELAGFKIGHDNDLAADHLLRSVDLAHAGEDLPDFTAQIYLEFEEFFAAFHTLSLFDGADLEFYFFEIVECDGHIIVAER